MPYSMLPKEQQLLRLYALLAKQTFLAIRWLSAGRKSLVYEQHNPLLDTFSYKQLHQYLTFIGQLSEAMHNLPIDENDVRERNDCAYTLHCFDRFIALQPELADRFDLTDLLRQIRALDPDVDEVMFKAGENNARAVL